MGVLTICSSSHFSSLSLCSPRTPFLVSLASLVLTTLCSVLQRKHLSTAMTGLYQDTMHTRNLVVNSSVSVPLPPLVVPCYSLTYSVPMVQSSVSNCSLVTGGSMLTVEHLLITTI